MNSKQKGFTLVELVVVIVILGILAATAVPRFINLTGSATTAAANGLIGAISSAVSICQASYFAAGGTGTNCNVIGNSVTVGAGTGIPVAAAGGINNALGNLNGWTFLSPTFTLTSSTACSVTYTDAGIATASGCP